MTLQNDVCVEITAADTLKEPAFSMPSEPVLIGFPEAWSARLAYLLSGVFSPPVLTPLAMVVAASTASILHTWVWLVEFFIFAILAPFLYLLWLKQRGLITDIDVQRRDQRMRPMIFTLVCGGVGWLAMAIGNAPRVMTFLAGGIWLQMVGVLVVTLRWKISIHCAAAAGAATVIWLLLGIPWPLLLGVPLVAWSRVRLSRHTLAQTVAGSVVGIAMSSGALLLV